MGVNAENPETELARLRLERDGAEAEVRRLREKLAEALTEIAELRASTSWRITAPLRAVMRRLRR